MKRLLPCRISTLAALSLLCQAPAAQGAEPSDPVWDTRVKSILESNCSGCHNEKQRTSGFSVASREDVLAGGARQGPAINPGNADASPLVKLLRGEMAPRMPVGKPALPEDQITEIANWINGLKPEAAAVRKEKWWAYQKPVKPAAPAV